MELNTATLGDFTKLADILWLDARDSVDANARNSGIFKVVDIPEGTGESREFSEIDLEQYSDTKGQGEQAGRARVQQGLKNTIAPVKSSLINGENLKTAIKRFTATLRNLVFSFYKSLQRLSEKMLLIIEKIIYEKK